MHKLWIMLDQIILIRNSTSLHYPFTILVCKDIRIRKFEYVAKTSTPDLPEWAAIGFFYLKSKRVLVFNSIIIYFTDLFSLYIFIQNAYANKKVFEKKANKLFLIMFNGSNCDRKSQLSGILTVPLNPRVPLYFF